MTMVSSIARTHVLEAVFRPDAILDYRRRDP
jgi:hypothetical protein